MNNTIQDNASTLWYTVSDQDTGLIYKQAFAKTWKILQQVFIIFLLLFIFLSAAVVYNIIRILLWPLERGITWATRYVEDVLGWQDPFKFEFLESADAIKVIPPAPVPEPTEDPVVTEPVQPVVDVGTTVNDADT